MSLSIMGSLSGLVHATATPFFRPSPVYASKSKQNHGLRASLNGDSLLQAATHAAYLRFQETHRPEPLFVDPYAGCFVRPNVKIDLKKYTHHYCLATKFIDDKLLQTVCNIDGLKQVVLFTDGMDARAYRLDWPTSTIVFDVSPERIFNTSAKTLQGVGAKIPRHCMYFHVPLESSNMQDSLIKKGFNGLQPSIWIIQGSPVMTLASFEEILLTISSLAMKGCRLMGELPAWFSETEVGMKLSSTERWVEKLFRSNGFRVNVIGYDEIAKKFEKELAPEDYKNILFVAEQLQHSDDQVERWRREMQRLEEEGDEEGFEEL